MVVTIKFALRVWHRCEAWMLRRRLLSRFLRRSIVRARALRAILEACNDPGPLSFSPIDSKQPNEPGKFAIEVQLQERSARIFDFDRCSIREEGRRDGVVVRAFSDHCHFTPTSQSTSLRPMRASISKHDGAARDRVFYLSHGGSEDQNDKCQSICTRNDYDHRRWQFLSSLAPNAGAERHHL